MKKIERSDRRFLNVSIVYKQATVTNILKIMSFWYYLTGPRDLVVKEPRLRCPSSRVRTPATADLTWFPFGLQDLPRQFLLDAVG